MYIRYYNAYSNHNLLPEPGGFLDQTNLFVEFCGVMDSTKSKAESYEMEQSKRKTKK